MKSITLHDEGTVELWDLSSNFYFSEDDIGKNRAIACVQKLQELNNTVSISTKTTKLSKEQLSNFQVFPIFVASVMMLWNSLFMCSGPYVSPFALLPFEKKSHIVFTHTK